MSAPLHVLMLEDCPDDAVLILRHLRQGGYDPREVCVDNADDLLAALDGRTWDVVIADYTLPGFSGLAALRMVRDRYPDLPFLIVSGDIGEETAVAAIKAGASDYLMKDRLSRLPMAVKREIQAAATRQVARQAEAALLDSREHLRMTLENANHGMWDWDIPSGRVILDDNWHAILGYQLGELTLCLETWEQTLHPEDKGRVFAALDAHLTCSESLYNVDYRGRCKKGTWIWINTRGRVCQRDAEGRPLRMMGTIHDISDRKLAEARLSQLAETERQKFVSLADSSLEFIGMSDCQFRPFYVNAAGLRLVGLDSLEQACRIKVQDCFFPEDQPFITHEFFPRVLRQGHSEVEIRFRHFQTGEAIWMQYNVFNIKDDTGTTIGWATVSRNIHERKRAEEQLRALNATLEQRVAERTATAQRKAEELARSNAELEQFAYVASHDLREPLRMVQSFCNLLQDRYGGQLDERAQRYIHFAVDGAARMQLLIDDLLEFSRVGRSNERFEDVRLDDVVQHALSNLQAAILESGARIELEFLPDIRGDFLRLSQLFQNLIGNALKFRRDEPPAIHIGACREDDAWRLTVTDNGIGIDPRHFPRLFVVFQRLHTRDEYPGTGIGLALCKRIVELHGGRIWLKSGPGCGTSVHFHLSANNESLLELEHEGAACVLQTVKT